MRGLLRVRLGMRCHGSGSRSRGADVGRVVRSSDWRSGVTSTTRTLDTLGSRLRADEARAEDGEDGGGTEGEEVVVGGRVFWRHARK